VKTRDDYLKKIKKFEGHLSSLKDFSAKMRNEINAEKDRKIQAQEKQLVAENAKQYQPTEEDNIPLVDWNN